MPPEDAGSTPAGSDEGNEDIVFSSEQEAQRAADRANGGDAGDDDVDADGNILLSTEGDAPSLTGDPQDDTSEEGASDESDDSDDAEPQEFANALKKAGGDKAKLGRLFWETQSRMAETTRERDAARAELERLKSGRSGPPAEEPDEDETPDTELADDLKWHTEGIAAVEAELKESRATQAALYERVLPPLKEAIVETRTILKLTEEDSPKYGAAKANHQAAIDEYNSKVREWHNLKRDIATNEKELRSLQRGKSTVEKSITRQQQEQEKGKREGERFKSEQSALYGSLVEEAFSASELDEEEHGERFRSMLKRQVVGVLTEMMERNGPRSPAPDLRKVVMSEAKALTSLMVSGRARAATSESRRKAETNARLRGNQRNGNQRVAAPARSDRQPAEPGAPRNAQPQRYVSPEEEAKEAMRAGRRAMGLPG